MTLEMRAETLAHMSIPNSGKTLCGIRVDDLGGTGSESWMMTPRMCQACLSEHARILHEKARGGSAPQPFNEGMTT